jgi:ribosome-binding factor A
MGEAADQRATLQALEHANGFLRHELAQRLSIRYTPEIVFRLDESIERGARVMNLMRQVREESATPVDAPSLTAPGPGSQE